MRLVAVTNVAVEMGLFVTDYLGDTLWVLNDSCYITAARD